MITFQVGREPPHHDSPPEGPDSLSLTMALSTSTVLFPHSGSLPSSAFWLYLRQYLWTSSLGHRFCQSPFQLMWHVQHTHSGKDGLRIVLVQLKNSFHDPATTSIASIDTLMSTPSPVGLVSDPCERPTSLNIADGPSVDVSSTTHLPSPADPEEQAAKVSVFL